MQRAVTALLGPTNTGKTHLAIERMLEHATGMIGFPLRLLARENYDRRVRARGAEAVALVTGEERIVPPTAVATGCARSRRCRSTCPWTSSRSTRSSSRPTASAATSSPTACCTRAAASRPAARGRDDPAAAPAAAAGRRVHHAAAAVDAALRRAASGSTGCRRAQRGDRRSPSRELYEVAERLRRERGRRGARVRRALAAHPQRPGRALPGRRGRPPGRDRRDRHGPQPRHRPRGLHQPRQVRRRGPARAAPRPRSARSRDAPGATCATARSAPTAELGGFDRRLVEAVESHRFEPLAHLYWRNRRARLLLAARARSPASTRSRRSPACCGCATPTTSGRSRRCARDPEIDGARPRPADVRLLWEVCQVPDFQNVLTEAHTRLLAPRLPLPARPRRALARGLGGRAGEGPRPHRGRHRRRCSRASRRSGPGPTSRTAPGWLADPRDLAGAHAGGRGPALRRAARAADAGVRGPGGHGDRAPRPVGPRDEHRRRRRGAGAGPARGRPGGLPLPARPRPCARARAALLAAANRALRASCASGCRRSSARRTRRSPRAREPRSCGAAPPWRASWPARARSRRGSTCWRATCSTRRCGSACGAASPPGSRRTCARRSCRSSRSASGAPPGLARGLAFALVEGLGAVSRRSVAQQVAALTRTIGRPSPGWGSRSAASRSSCPRCSARGHAPAGTTLRGAPGAPGRERSRRRAVRPARPAPPAAFYLACGYLPAGPRAVRLDRLERAAAVASRLSRDGPFVPPRELAPILGCRPDEVPAVLSAIGYVEKDGRFERRRPRARQELEARGLDVVEKRATHSSKS